MSGARVSVVDPILDAAAELFEKRGYDEVTMEAIADRAGVGRTTVFRRYESKTQLLAGIVESFFDAFSAYTADRELDTTEGEAPVVRAEHVLRALREFCERRGPLARVAFGARNLPWVRPRLDQEPERIGRLARYCLGPASARPLLCCFFVEALRHAAAEPAAGGAPGRLACAAEAVRVLGTLAGGTPSTGGGTSGTAESA